MLKILQERWLSLLGLNENTFFGCQLYIFWVLQRSLTHHLQVAVLVWGCWEWQVSYNKVTNNRDVFSDLVSTNGSANDPAWICTVIYFGVIWPIMQESVRCWGAQSGSRTLVFLSLLLKNVLCPWLLIVVLGSPVLLSHLCGPHESNTCSVMFSVSCLTLASPPFCALSGHACAGPGGLGGGRAPQTHLQRCCILSSPSVGATCRFYRHSKIKHFSWHSTVSPFSF